MPCEGQVKVGEGDVGGVARRPCSSFPSCKRLVLPAHSLSALFFRSWRQTGHRIFFFFGAGFWFMALSWALLALLNPDDETRPLIYFIRLCAYVVLIVGMINRKGR